MPAGRPTDYRPEYCERVVAMGKEGKSPAQMAAALDVDRSTLGYWAGKHDEFSTALSRARTFCQEWWEDVGQASLNKDKFQSSVWRKSMEARFREDYTERKDHTVHGAINVTISKDDGNL